MGEFRGEFIFIVNWASLWKLGFEPVGLSTFPSVMLLCFSPIYPSILFLHLSTCSILWSFNNHILLQGFTIKCLLDARDIFNCSITGFCEIALTDVIFLLHGGDGDRVSLCPGTKIIFLILYWLTIVCNSLIII